MWVRDPIRSLWQSLPSSVESIARITTFSISVWKLEGRSNRYIHGYFRMNRPCHTYIIYYNKSIVMYTFYSIQLWYVTMWRSTSVVVSKTKYLKKCFLGTPKVVIQTETSLRSVMSHVLLENSAALILRAHVEGNVRQQSQDDRVVDHNCS